MMKTVKVGNRSFSMKRVRTFSPAEKGFDQEGLAKKYPKAMSALVILTLAHQANPLKALLAIASGKRQYDEKFTEKLLADAEKFISTLSDRKRTFSKGYRITEKDYEEYCDWQEGKIDSTRLLDIIKDEGEYEDEMGQWAENQERAMSTSNKYRVMYRQDSDSPSSLKVVTAESPRDAKKIIEDRYKNCIVEGVYEYIDSRYPLKGAKKLYSPIDSSPESTSNFSDDEKYIVYLEGGSIGTQSNARVGSKRVSVVKSGLTREEALEYKTRSNKNLSPGEKKYYRMKYGLAPESKVHYMSQKDYSEITSDEDFREYAHKVMKAAHGEDYSEEVTNKVVDELLKNNKGAEYGELIGRLTSGFGDKSFADNWDRSELPLNKVFKKVNIQQGLYDAMLEYTKSVFPKGFKDIEEVTLNGNGFQLDIRTNTGLSIWTIGYTDLVKYLGEHHGFTAAARLLK